MNPHTQIRRIVPASERSGFTVVELMAATSVMIIGALALVSSIVSGIKLGQVNRQTSIAFEGARQFTEELQSVSFEEIFANFNQVDLDDPVGGAPGKGFEIVGLTPVEGDDDGLVGEVIFPSIIDADGQEYLREDLDDERLGLPRDLDGDGVVSAVNVTGEYTVLPVRIRVRWTGISGDRTLDLEHIIIQ